MAYFQLLQQSVPRGISADDWEEFASTMVHLVGPAAAPTDKLAQLIDWYTPVLGLRYDNPEPRCADLQMLLTISRSFRGLSEVIDTLTLDAPNATGAWGDDAHHDEDYLILSTVHSAKGQEWQSVYMINVADGNFPNEFSTSDAKGLAEERRLLYVGLTRAREHLELIEPMRYYLTQQPKQGGAHVYGARSRFLNATVLGTLDFTSDENCQVETGDSPNDKGAAAAIDPINIDATATISSVADRIKSLWV